MRAPAVAYAHLLDDARAVLRAWVAPDAAQERLREEFLMAFAAGPAVLAKTGGPTHVTASVVVVDTTASRALLVLHRRARAWLQPGGHLEPTDATLRDAAGRETTEESGVADLAVDAQPLSLSRYRLAAGFGACLEHLDVCYAATAPAAAQPRVSGESARVAWCDLHALPDDAPDTGVAALVRAARATSRR